MSTSLSSMRSWHDDYTAHSSLTDPAVQSLLPCSALPLAGPLRRLCALQKVRPSTQPSLIPLRPAWRRRQEPCGLVFIWGQDTTQFCGRPILRLTDVYVTSKFSFSFSVGTIRPLLPLRLPQKTPRMSRYPFKACFKGSEFTTGHLDARPKRLFRAVLAGEKGNVGMNPLKRKLQTLDGL